MLLTILTIIDEGLINGEYYSTNQDTHDAIKEVVSQYCIEYWADEDYTIQEIYKKEPEKITMKDLINYHDLVYLRHVNI